MEPNLREGDLLKFRRIAPSDLQRGDVILLERDQHELVKRLIGLPGETVEIRDGQVFIDGALLVEPYEIIPASYSVEEVTLPDGSYFVLGDNRGSSSDSHVWGPISGDAIKGKLVDHEP